MKNGNSGLRAAAESKRTDGKRVRTLIAALTAVLGLLALSAAAWTQATPQPTKEARHGKSAVHAKHAKTAATKMRRVISVTINKGDTYTISDLKQGAKTDSQPGKNPNALSIQQQPSGDIVLLGTEGGSWKIDATLADGEEVTYDVKVKAEAPPINSLTPGTAPTTIPP